jgi:hypothetical protein
MLLGTTLAAQPGPRDPSSRFRPNWVDADVNVRKALANFADCVVDGQAKLTREMLLRSSYELQRKDAALFGSECMPDEIVSDGDATLQMTVTVVRFSLASALFSRELADFDPSRLAGAPALPAISVDQSLVAKARAKLRKTEDIAKFDQGTARVQRDLAYYRFGDCVVRQNPAEAKALLLTKIETADESQALDRLRPTLKECQAADQHPSLAPADVRGTVALSFVRLAYAVPGVSAR